jgi:hypothetical protein|tara:strand:+ start:2332 stop:2484 length:153 start_codon:yes stop_codon:yes gene_type:complete
MEEKQQTLGNAIKFQLELMVMMVSADRLENAASAYDRIIQLCDKAGQKRW